MRVVAGQYAAHPYPPAYLPNSPLLALVLLRRRVPADLVRAVGRVRVRGRGIVHGDRVDGGEGVVVGLVRGVGVALRVPGARGSVLRGVGRCVYILMFVVIVVVIHLVHREVCARV